MKPLSTSLLLSTLCTLWLMPAPPALAQAPTEEDLKEMERQAEQLEKQQERSMPGAPAMETQTQIAEPERPEAALERNDFPWLGVDFREFSGSDRPKGLQVTQIGFDSPAAKAGIKANDLILAWDGKELKKPEELPSLVQATPIGKTVEVKISRNGTIQTVKVTVESLLKAAEGGNVAAQYRMGNRYLRGEGVAKDPAEAVRWYRQAADRGDPSAMFALGSMYKRGEGLAKDPAEAVRSFRQAADSGYPDAMYMLGYMYERGEGLAKDPAEAVRWFRQAADRGDPSAMHALGLMYERGEGLAKDPAEAVRWFRQAADRGDPDAMYMLGYMYERGEGLAKDRTEAARWVFKALEKGDDFTVKQMTTNAGAWNINFRKALQMQLRDAGLYMGAIDGKFGPAVKRAIGTLAKREQQE